MNAQANLGKVLGRIRRIRGLSLEECEAQLRGVPTGTLREGEAGRGLTDSLIRALARLHGLDAELLEEGQIRPVSGVQGSTVFLLHNGNQDFSAADLAALEEGLAAGRMLCASGECRAAIATRASFAPVPVAGPESRDAARQGHRLANQVRSVLGLRAEPLGDLGRLLQDQLGIALFVPQFATESVEAASIIDSGRLAACAMLSPAARPDDARVRVLLAHELCHVLFDPARPGTVRLSMHRGEKSTALEESRAKGFAAEFLLPRVGLLRLLGEPKQEQGHQAARVLVQRAREAFLTTSEITVWHLKNHEFISWEIADELVKEAVPAQVEVNTSLPAPGHHLIAAPPESLQSDVETSVVLSKLVEKRAPSLREEAAHQLLEKARGGDELEATDDLLLELDRHLAASNFGLVGDVLDAADCTALPPSVLGGLLLLSKAARVQLPTQTRRFEARALDALSSRLSAADLRRVREQFA